MPKLILVKSSTANLPSNLLPAVADEYDGTTEMVILTTPIAIDNELTLNVPLALCFEFDPDVMELVNTLVVAAMDKLDAARKYMDMKLVGASFAFEDGGDAPPLVNH